MIISYESVRQLIERIPSATTPGVRDIEWVTEAHVVGVSRDLDGHVEIYLVGSELAPASALVREALEYRVVHRDGLHSFDANRLAFPALAHFDQIAAFICTELLRSGVDLSLETGFAITEPIIELAIERLQQTDRVLVGLFGELLLLEAMCRGAADSQVSRVVESWDGWKRSSRDFSVGAVGVEVKTTTGRSSSHFIEGVHQVERDPTVADGVLERRLLLVSIGVQAAAREVGALTIPALVDRIVERMNDAGLDQVAVDRFLWRLSEYGGASGGGYQHGVPTSDPAYSSGFLTTFFRAYDMSDDSIKVLRRQDITERAHVDAGSVKFRIDLPTTVSFGNPIVGANQVAKEALGGL